MKESPPSWASIDGFPYESEKEIHSAVIKHWEIMGVKDSLVATLANEYAHGQPGLTPGLADLLIIGPGGFVGFMELKSAKGRLSKAQERFRAICDACGVPHRVTRGRDEPIEVLAEWGIVRPSTSSGGR